MDHRSGTHAQVWSKDSVQTVKMTIFTAAPSTPAGLKKLKELAALFEEDGPEIVGGVVAGDKVSLKFSVTKIDRSKVRGKRPKAWLVASLELADMDELAPPPVVVRQRLKKGVTTSTCLEALRHVFADALFSTIEVDLRVSQTLGNLPQLPPVMVGGRLLNVGGVEYRIDATGPGVESIRFSRLEESFTASVKYHTQEPWPADFWLAERDRALQYASEVVRVWP